MSRSSLLRSIGLRTLVPIGILMGASSAVLASTPSNPASTLAQDGFDAIMGEELVVEGFRYRKLDILRAVVSGNIGASPLRNLKLRLLIAQEVSRRIKGGASPQSFLISDDEVNGAVEEQAQFLKEQYPDGAYTVENMMDGGLKAFKTQLQLTRLFNKTYLPEGDPDELPPATLLALNHSDMGKAVIEQLKQEWEQNKLRETPIKKNPLYQSILFREIFEYLLETSTIESGSAVPPEVLVRINGDDITVLDLWEEVKDVTSVDDVILAKKWLANMHLLRKGLADVWLPDAEAKKRYDEHAEPFDKSMIPLKNFALGIKRFPSMTAYREYRHAYDSFKKRIQAEITPDALREFADLRTRKLVGGSTVDVDVILISAYDFKNRKWKENGWALAEERAREVINLLKEKRDWDEVLDEYSEFYDAPVAGPESQSANFLKYKGRFRNQGRNELMQKLGEDEFQAFLNGGTLADYIFFTLEEGSVGGVKKGPHGWYIPLMRKRTEKPIKNDQTQLIIMAEQDYVDVHLGLYLNELFKNAKIEGMGR